MIPRTFHSFVKMAAELQLRDERVPADYIPVHEAVLEKFPKLASILGHLEDATEVAGLAALAIPSIQEMRHKPMSEKKKAVLEIGGLGVLAVPAAAKLIHSGIKHFRGAPSLASKIRSGIKHFRGH